MNDITTVEKAKMGDLPFWDEANANQLTFVGCFPDDGVDCPFDHAIVGIMGEDGVFRSLAFSFMPSADIWRCGHDGSGERIEISRGEDGRGYRPPA